MRPTGSASRHASRITHRGNRTETTSLDPRADHAAALITDYSISEGAKKAEEEDRIYYSEHRAQARRWRASNRAKGLCHCGRARDREDRKTCAECRSRTLARRNGYIADGLCAECGCEKEPGREELKSCKHCTRVRNEKFLIAQHKKTKQYQQERACNVG